jgi:hypothetical protein
LIYARSTKGVSASVVAVVVVVVVAAGAGVIYYTPAGSSLLSTLQSEAGSGGNGQATNGSSSSLTASTTGSSSNASLVTTSTSGSGSANAGACLLNGTSLSSNTSLLNGWVSAIAKIAKVNETANEIFGNFSQMAVSTNAIINGSAVGGTTVDSFSVVGRPVIGSSTYREVNFTLSGFGVSYKQTALFAPNGSATSVTSATLGNFKGSLAARQGQSLVSPFLYEFQTSAYAKAIVASPDVVIVNESKVSLGPTSVDMTYYTLKSLPLTICGSTITKALVGVGTAPGTNTPLVLYETTAVSELRTSIETTTSVVSLAAAGP